MNRTFVNIVGAVTLLVGAASEVVYDLVSPIDPGAPAAINIAAIHANPAGADTALLVDLGILLLIPAPLFAGRVLDASRRTLAGLATGMLVLSALAFTYSLGGDVVLVAAAQHNAPAVADAYADSTAVGIATLLALVLQFVGFVLLGIAALRSRLIPIWAAVFFMVWDLVQVAGVSLGIQAVTTLGDLMLLAAFAACAVRQFRPVAGRATKRLEPGAPVPVTQPVAAR